MAKSEIEIPQRIPLSVAVTLVVVTGTIIGSQFATNQELRSGQAMIIKLLEEQRRVTENNKNRIDDHAGRIIRLEVRTGIASDPKDVTGTASILVDGRAK